MAEEERRNGGGGDQVGEKMAAVESQPTTTTTVAVVADWANLLPELLRLIGEKLSNISDYVRFRSICPSWRMAVGPGDHIQPFLPWTIGLNRTSNNIFYYNFADDCGYLLDLPEEAQGKWIYGSNYGWLVVTAPPHDIHPTTVSILNPITKAQIQLPSLPDSLVLSTSTNFILCSNPVSPPPPPRQPLLAAWNHGDDTTVILCQGDHNWTLFNAPAMIHDCTYFDGRLYCVDLDGRLAVLDDVATSSLRQLIEPQPPKVATDCPVQFSIEEFAGDLLMFPRYDEVTDELINLVALSYKLDISGKEGWKWVAVNGSTFTSRVNPEDQTDKPDQYEELHCIDQSKAITDGITTRKYHHCQIMGNKLILVPNLN